MSSRLHDNQIKTSGNQQTRTPHSSTNSRRQPPEERPISDHSHIHTGTTSETGSSVSRGDTLASYTSLRESLQLLSRDHPWKSYTEPNNIKILFNQFLSLLRGYSSLKTIQNDKLYKRYQKGHQRIMEASNDLNQTIEDSLREIGDSDNAEVFKSYLAQDADTLITKARDAMDDLEERIEQWEEKIKCTRPETLDVEGHRVPLLTDTPLLHSPSSQRDLAPPTKHLINARNLDEVVKLNELGKIIQEADKSVMAMKEAWVNQERSISQKDRQETTQLDTGEATGLENNTSLAALIQSTSSNQRLLTQQHNLPQGTRSSMHLPLTREAPTTTKQPSHQGSCKSWCTCENCLHEIHPPLYHSKLPNPGTIQQENIIQPNSRIPYQANSTTHHNLPAFSNESPNYPALTGTNSLPPLSAGHSAKGHQYPHVAMPGLSIPTPTQPSQVATKTSDQPSGANGPTREDYRSDQPHQEPPDLECRGRTMGRQEQIQNHPKTPSATHGTDFTNQG